MLGGKQSIASNAGRSNIRRPEPPNPLAPDLAARILEKVTRGDEHRHLVAAAYRLLAEKWTGFKRGRDYLSRAHRVLYAMESRRLAVSDDGMFVRLESERSDVRGDPQTEKREAARLAAEIRTRVDDPWRFLFFSWTWMHRSPLPGPERRAGLQAWDRFKRTPVWERYVKGGVCVDDCTFSTPLSRAAAVRRKMTLQGPKDSEEVEDFLDRIEEFANQAAARTIEGGHDSWFHPHFHGVIELERAQRVPFRPERFGEPADWRLVEGLEDEPDYRSAEAAVHRWLRTLGERLPSGERVPATPEELAESEPQAKWLVRARRWVRARYMTTAAKDCGAFLYVRSLGKWKGGVASVAREVAKYAVPVGKMADVRRLAQWLECIDHAQCRRRFGSWRKPLEVEPEDLGDVPEHSTGAAAVRVKLPDSVPSVHQAAALLVLLENDYGRAQWAEGLRAPTHDEVETSRAVLSALAQANTIVPPPYPLHSGGDRRDRIDRTDRRVGTCSSSIRSPQRCSPASSTGTGTTTSSGSSGNSLQLPLLPGPREEGSGDPGPR